MQRFLRYLPSLAIFTATAAVDPPAGFIAHPERSFSYWTKASGRRIEVEGRSIRVHRDGREVSIHFPGAEMRWEPEGRQGVVHFTRRNSPPLVFATSLVAREAWRGVDVAVDLQDGRLKTEFRLAPGVPASSVEYCLQGASARVELGGLQLRAEAGGESLWQERGLAVWQVGPDGKRRPVDARFQVRDNCVSIATGDLDALPTVIDPEIVFSTYLGGGLFDAVTSVVLDAQGNTYLGGWTESADFPVQSALQGAKGGSIDGFVVKLNPAGSLVFATYLGGSAEDRVTALAVDGAGAVTAVGFTASGDFPRQSAALGALAGGRDAFVTRLNASGSGIQFSTYAGGTGHDLAWGVCLDPSGNIVVVGQTASPNFPLQNSFDISFGGGVDGFILRFTPAGQLLSSSFFGGGGDDVIRGVTTGVDGTIHMAGSTASNDFPLASPAQPARNGAMDAFYVRMNNAASALQVSTYWGGSGGSLLSEEAAYAVALDSQGRAWIAGVTPSTDFPGRSAGYQGIYGGGLSDGFVSVFGSNGTNLWSTYTGGTGHETITALAATPEFMAAAGHTTSADLPRAGSPQPTRAGEYDAFWMALPLGAGAPFHVSYLGGAGSDSGLAVAASGGRLVVGGSTLSSNLPLVTPLQSNNPGGFGGFAAKIAIGPEVVQVTPAAGGNGGSVFTMSLRHPSGYAAIGTAHLLLNLSLSNINGCYVVYNRPANSIQLYQDATGSWTSLSVGSAATMENNQCRVSGVGLTVNGAGNSLTLTVPVTFKPGISGDVTIYGNVVDLNGLSSGWLTAGTWPTYIAAPPVAAGVNPSSGAGFSQTFTFTLSDPNGAGEITSAEFIFHPFITSGDSCYLIFNRALNRVQLFRDSGGPLSITPGAAGTIENQNCAVGGSGLAVSANGNLLTLTLPMSFKQSYIGAKKVYAVVFDTGGRHSGWTQLGTWTVPSPVPPAVSGAVPSSSNAITQNFSFTAADGDGYADIATFSILVNETISGYNACHLYFNRFTNLFYLYRDEDAAWQPIAPGSASTVSNSNCVIAGQGLSVSGSGNNLTVGVRIQAKPGFTGTKNIYLLATDVYNGSSGWVASATWTLAPPSAPAPGTASPSSGFGLSMTLQVPVTDANGASDITNVVVLINSSINGSNGCFLSFYPAGNTVYLLRDSDSAWMGLTLGSAASVSNGNCTVSGAGASAVANGTTLTLTVPLTFQPAFGGNRNVYVTATDAGNLSSPWVTAGTWNPTGQASPPVVASLTPSSGSGPAQTFVAAISDPNGHADIAGLVFLINTVIDGNNACFFTYSRAENRFYLLRDSDSQWLPVVPGAAGSSASNLNCTLSSAGMSVSGSGNVLTLSLPLTFTAAFAGNRTLYVLATDASNLSSGWVAAGTWNPASTPNQPPTVTSLSPSSGSGSSPTFTLVLSDANGQGDLTGALILINTAIDGNNACFLSYSRSANTFYLASGSDWLPLAVGSGGSVSSPQCTLRGSGLAVTGSGNSLTMSVPLTFAGTFKGVRNVYAVAIDAANANSGWITAGSWSP